MENLPLEIKKIISAFTYDATKRQLRLASSTWFKLVDYRDFTLYLTKESEWKQIVDRFEHYNAPISLKLKKNLLKEANDIFEHLTRLTTLEHFEIASLSDGDYEDWYKLTAMTALKLMPDFHMPLDMWKKLTQLEAFNFFNSSNKISLSEITDVVTNLTNLHDYVSVRTKMLIYCLSPPHTQN
jgi:hypothetical protein